MFRIRALKNNEQIQSIEYEDREYGLAQMQAMFPDCEIEITDMDLEKQSLNLENN